jgi:two-component system OmpR family sensor kinase
MAERHPLRRRSIRVRLVVRTLAAAAVVLLAAGWAATTVVDKQLREQIDRRLEDDIKGAVVAVDVLTPEQQATMSQRNTMSKYAVIVVGREAVRVASAPADAGDVAGATGGLTVERLRQEDGDAFTLEGSPDLRVAAQPMSDGLYLAFAAPLGEVSSAISTVRWAALLIGVCALGLLAVLVSLIGRSVVRPLEEMIDAADAIGAGDLDRRAPDGQADAESERLAVALNAMLERLATSFREQQASERELRDFVSEAAHELRTPLATVQASAEILSETTLDPADVAVVARRVNTQTRRMAHLVDDLVLLARLQQGADLEQMELNVCDVAEGAVDRATARQPGWPTRLEMPSEPIVVAGDPVRLEQVVDDLLDNVAVHTPLGTTAVVRVKDHGSQVVIEVHDDGPGLPRADLERACERLYRGESARLEGRPGSGLGLAIVRGVVEAHGGTLVLRDGDGFTAEITLPVSAAASRSDTEPSARSRVR